MDHSIIKDKIFELYDGEISLADRAVLKSHLAACVECHEHYERWAKTAKVLFQAPKPVPSEFFVHRVMDRIHDLAKPKARAHGWGLSLQWLVPAAGVMAVYFAVAQPFPAASPLAMEMLMAAPGDIGVSVVSGHTPTADETLEFVIGGES